MVKNLPTVERSTKIRLGKHCTEDQAENTIVLNASNVEVDASSGKGVYITPLDLAIDFTGSGTDATTNTIVTYNQSTHKLYRTNIPPTFSGISTGNSEFEKTTLFSNAITGIIVDSNIVVGGNVTCSELIVTGNVTALGDVNQVLTTKSLFTDRSVPSITSLKVLQSFTRFFRTSFVPTYRKTFLFFCSLFLITRGLPRMRGEVYQLRASHFTPYFSKMSLR